MSRLVPGLILALFALAAPALAQDGVPISFGQSLRLDGSALEVTADTLQVDQTTGASEFSGNVLAVQGDMRIAAGALRLEYAPGNSEGSQRISRLI
ncbi:MAG: lipopolysaccharide transport periplasmic protein LptA, partial [Rhodobacteraceae bacterium]|nr:lipopolysaccharide transport periplasmic protein LptA [Paracoccaceae bacterium]